MNSNIKEIFQKASDAHKNGNLQEALVNYKKIVEIKPDSAEAHNNLGILLHAMNRFDGAEKSFKKGLLWYSSCYI